MRKLKKGGECGVSLFLKVHFQKFIKGYLGGWFPEECSIGAGFHFSKVLLWLSKVVQKFIGGCLKVVLKFIKGCQKFICGGERL